MGYLSSPGLWSHVAFPQVSSVPSVRGQLLGPCHSSLSPTRHSAEHPVNIRSMKREDGTENTAD